MVADHYNRTIWYLPDLLQQYTQNYLLIMFKNNIIIIQYIYLHVYDEIIET